MVYHMTLSDPWPGFQSHGIFRHWISPKQHDIDTRIRKNFPPPCILCPSWQGSPWNWVSARGVQKLEWWSISWLKSRYRMSIVICTLSNSDISSDFEGPLTQFKDHGILEVKYLENCASSCSSSSSSSRVQLNFSMLKTERGQHDHWWRVQKQRCWCMVEMDKKMFSTSAPHGSCATPYTEMVEYQDTILWEIESLKILRDKVTIAL